VRSRPQKKLAVYPRSDSPHPNRSVRLNPQSERPIAAILRRRFGPVIEDANDRLGDVIRRRIHVRRIPFGILMVWPIC
jgi:hypothetical protein